MGVSVRRKKGTDKFYIHVRHSGERIAFKYNTEDEALDVAKELRRQISLGLLDVIALKKNGKSRQVM